MNQDMTAYSHAVVSIQLNQELASFPSSLKCLYGAGAAASILAYRNPAAAEFVTGSENNESVRHHIIGDAIVAEVSII